MNPFRVSSRAFGQAFYEALNPVSPQPFCGGCASLQCSHYQIGIFSAEPYATVFHVGYDPIVQPGGQGAQ